MAKVSKEKCKEYNAKAYKKLKANPEKYKAKIEKQNEWRKRKYPNYWTGYERELILKNKYGLTNESYSGLLKYQNNLCAICEKECESGRSLAVDHCHETGIVRGLLCRKCNVGIGNFRDSTNLLNKAIAYLEKER